MIDVREARNADAERVSDFLATAWAEAGPDAPGFAGATDADIEAIRRPAAVRRRLGGPERRMFVACEEGTVVGFAATRRIDERSTELAGIVVLDRLAGHGIGTRLVAAALGSCRDDGARRVVVRTETDNHRARKFYEALGFEATSVLVEHVSETPVEVVELVVHLTGST
jgi:ribosomal protein S18 acetylase RimI-like enzyme